VLRGRVVTLGSSGLAAGLRVTLGARRCTDRSHDRPHARQSTEAEMTTMHDIARLASVSLSTVSYALSGTRPVSQATKDRIG